MRILDQLRAKRKSEWRKLVADKVVGTTLWIQERGDRSLVVGLGSGIIIVLFFRLVFSLLVIAAVVGTTVYLFAQDD